MRSKIFKILIGFIFLTIITFSAFWFFLTYQAQTRITDWAASQSNGNIQISWQDFHFTGYPFKIRMLIEKSMGKFMDSYTYYERTAEC